MWRVRSRNELRSNRKVLETEVYLGKKINSTKIVRCINWEKIISLKKFLSHEATDDKLLQDDTNTQFYSVLFFCLHFLI